MSEGRSGVAGAVVGILVILIGLGLGLLPSGEVDADRDRRNLAFRKVVPEPNQELLVFVMAAARSRLDLLEDLDAEHPISSVVVLDHAGAYEPVVELV